LVVVVAVAIVLVVHVRIGAHDNKGARDCHGRAQAIGTGADGDGGVRVRGGARRRGCASDNVHEPVPIITDVGGAHDEQGRRHGQRVAVPIAIVTTIGVACPRGTGRRRPGRGARVRVDHADLGTTGRGVAHDDDRAVRRHSKAESAATRYTGPAEVLGARQLDEKAKQKNTEKSKSFSTPSHFTRPPKTEDSPSAEQHSTAQHSTHAHTHTRAQTQAADPLLYYFCLWARRTKRHQQECSSRTTESVRWHAGCAHVSAPQPASQPEARTTALIDTPCFGRS